MNDQAIAPGRRSSKKTQFRFQRLWEEAESVAKENLELDKTFDSRVPYVGVDIRRAGLESFVQRVKTLKTLKELLADRYERNRFDERWF